MPIATDLKFLEVDRYQKVLVKRTSVSWQTEAQQSVLKKFHYVAEAIPAYKDFLKKHQISHAKIKSIEDFSQVPLTDKTNYIQRYPINKRMIQGGLDRVKIIASSSGTTGYPNYWPRTVEQELEAAKNYSLIYKTFFNAGKAPTLLIIGFPMGVYVSGVAALLASWVGGVNENITIVSAGNNKQAVLETVKNLGSGFKKIILIGHPFFIKDCIESANKQGINWKKIKPNLLFCSEGFTEDWREYVLAECGIKQKYGASVSMYGSSEFLLTGFETPLTILLKELGERNINVRQNLFEKHHTPNVFQYNPIERYIESVSGELVISSDGAVPLMRFNMHDAGRVIPFIDAVKTLDENIPRWKSKISKWPIWPLPLVSLWGRSDHSVVFYAANIYPDHIHTALAKKDFFKKLTGKFTLEKDYFKNMDEYLNVHIELRHNIQLSKSLSRQIQKQLVKTLKEINREYLFLTEHLDKDLTPRVKLWPYGHEQYFKLGLKPVYIKK